MRTDAPRPAISVLMPVRDGARHLPEALGSILAQTWRDFEVVAVDDGSDDATPAVLSRFAAADGRVRVFRRPPRGIVAALNDGLQQARAPLVARMDADDAAMPNRLALQAAAFAARPGLLALGGACRVVGAGLPRLRRPPVAPGDVRAALQRGNPMIHPTITYQRAAVLDAGGYRSAFPFCEDYDLWLRLAERGDVANLPDVLLDYREHPAQSTRQDPERRILSEIGALHAARRRSAGLSEELGPAGATMDRAALRRLGLHDADISAAIIPRALGTAMEARLARDRGATRAACALLLRQPGLRWRTRLHAHLLRLGLP